MPKENRPPGQGGRRRISHRAKPVIIGRAHSSLRTSSPQLIEPRDCPRFDRCSANICPLDADWGLRQHLKGERICFYLTELVKPGGMVRIDTRLSSELAGKVSNTHPAIVARFCEIRYELKRAAKRPPRLGRRVGVRKREVA